MSLSMLRGNFKLQDAEQGKVHKQPAILFISKEESTKELDKVKITLRVSPNAIGSDAKNNITKNRVAKFKSGNPKELINWRIRWNHVIQNKLCKLPESRFDMVEMLLGGKVLQYWQQFKSQATGLPILGVLDEDEEESSEEDKDGKEKEKKDKGQSSASVVAPADITKETYNSSMRKFMCYYFVNHQFAVRTQKHYLWNYLQKPKDQGIWHVVARLREINSMLPYFPQPSNPKLPEDKLIEIILQRIPAGWKRTMTCANFKPLKHSMEELVEFFKGAKCLEIENPPKKNDQNNNNSSGLKKTKKDKRKHDEDKKS
eukprot:13755070-Ditylum_brightwellii.AAC.1